jgi:limonene-1,2-epoxide hydrolase
MNDQQRTEAFFEQWGVSMDAMEASFRNAFSPDCLWEQRPLAVTRGPEEAIRFLRRAKLGIGLETVQVELRHIIASPDGTVHTERLDHLRRADDGLIVTAPVAGVLNWQDGQIVAWREYFDSATFIARALPRLITGTAQRATSRFGGRRR